MCHDSMAIYSCMYVHVKKGLFYHNNMLNANDTFNLGAFFVLIIGGRSEACDALDDCWLLKIEDYSLTKVICN